MKVKLTKNNNVRMTVSLAHANAFLKLVGLSNKYARADMINFFGGETWSNMDDEFVVEMYVELDNLFNKE